MKNPSPFLIRILPHVDREGREWGGGYGHWCPGCKSLHVFATDHRQENGAQWTFNGHTHKPTFSPSMKVRWGMKTRDLVCHYFLREGMLQFLRDSTHELAGQTVPLPELPDHLKGESEHE